MKKFLPVVLIMFLTPLAASAVTVVIEIDTGIEEINALEATLVLPEGMRVSQIETGNSAILMWITPPRREDNLITFAGITPGGFFGIQPIFTVNGNFSTDDLKEARFENVLALENDGSGGSVPVILSFSLAESKRDTESPENFTPVVASDPNVFDGKYFLVFATQDKGSGIKRYEVREGSFGWWREAESPYLLKSQKLNKDIYVRAIDNASNDRVVVLPSQVHSSWWEEPGLFVILIVVVLAAVLYRRVWTRSTK